MHPILPMLALAVALSGCQHIQLENHTLRQASTLSDLQYRQVLSNIAMFSENCNSLPYYSLVGAGTTNISDNVSASDALSFEKVFNDGQFLGFRYDKNGASLGGQITSGEQWGTTSVLNPDALLLMRCVYQMTVCGSACDCDCQKNVATYFERNPCYLEAMHPGWFGVGKLKDVPKCAAHVGRYGKIYAWVMPDGVDNLSKLSLAILDIGTAVKPGDAGRINPVAMKIALLSDLASNLDKWIKMNPDQAILAALKNDLNNVLKTLEALNRYTPEQILASQTLVTEQRVVTIDGQQRTVTVLVEVPISDEFPHLTPAIKSILSQPVTSPTPDRILFYPNQANILPTTIPQIITPPLTSATIR
jgi:hypothetical protein